jgi:hypothetical protein
MLYHVKVYENRNYKIKLYIGHSKFLFLPLENKVLVFIADLPHRFFIASNSCIEFYINQLFILTLILLKL